MNHVMIDLETYGLTADCAIRSIGAYAFAGPEKGKVFYANVDENQPGRVVCPETVKWWSEQNHESQKAFENNKIDLETALDNFKKFFGSFLTEYRVWANGAEFDLAILNHAYKNKTPWHYKNVQSMRTLAFLFPHSYKAALPTTPENPKPHHALNDAIWQGQVCLNVLESVGIL